MSTPASSSAQHALISVMNPKYCVPCSTHIVVTQKVLSVTQGDYTITDIKGNDMFKVEGQFLSLRSRRILYDKRDGGSGTSIATIKQKLLSLHSAWEVYRGYSSEEEDLLFTVKRSQFFQDKPELDVFLAANNAQLVRDFIIQGSSEGDSCIIYQGNSKTSVIAQMHKKETFGDMLIGKDVFVVEVSPNVDCAFIATLIVILDGIVDSLGIDDVANAAVNVSNVAVTVSFGI